MSWLIRDSMDNMRRRNRPTVRIALNEPRGNQPVEDKQVIISLVGDKLSVSRKEPLVVSEGEFTVYATTMRPISNYIVADTVKKFKPGQLCECDICYDEHKLEDYCYLECSHKMCVQCFNGLLKHSSTRISCPTCRHVVYTLGFGSNNITSMKTAIL